MFPPIKVIQSRLKNCFTCHSSGMLWPLLILGYAVLVTSRPSSSIADDLFDGVTWRVLPPMLRQAPSQWMSPYDRPEPGNVTDLTKTLNCVEIASTGGTTVINEFLRVWKEMGVGIFQIPDFSCVEKPKKTAETLIQGSRAKIKNFLTCLVPAVH